MPEYKLCGKCGQPVEDDPALHAGADTQCSMNMKSESHAAISGVSVKPERDGGDDELIVKTVRTRPSLMLGFQPDRSHGLASR